MANSCGSLANCVENEQLKTHVDQFKIRESKKKEKFSKKERQEQRIIDLLTVKGSINIQESHSNGSGSVFSPSEKADIICNQLLIALWGNSEYDRSPFCS